MVRISTTEQLWSSVRVERKARSIRQVDPFGLTCMMVLPVAGKMNTKCQIICENRNDEAQKNQC